MLEMELLHKSVLQKHCFPLKEAEAASTQPSFSISDKHPLVDSEPGSIIGFWGTRALASFYVVISFCMQ